MKLRRPTPRVIEPLLWLGMALLILGSLGAIWFDMYKGY